MAFLVGTSGWQYADWKGEFYPIGLPTKRWLEYYAGIFSTVEINNAFYRLPDRSMFEKWRERTPEGFVIASKASRYLTHIRRLHEPAEPVARLVDRARGLGDKLGPILLQLPPTLQVDLEALDETLSSFPRDIRVAVEPRHPSWFVDGTAEILTRHGSAFCLADAPYMRAPHWRTADWGYVRFHEGRSSPRPCYGRVALHTWAKKLMEIFGEGQDVYVYFNNDTHACAPRNALAFIRILDGIASNSSPVHHAASPKLINDAARSWTKC